jgi:hypothetical protein
MLDRTIVLGLMVLIEHEWLAIQLIADELIARKQLDYSDVMRLIESA